MENVMKDIFLIEKNASDVLSFNFCVSGFEFLYDSYQSTLFMTRSPHRIYFLILNETL